VPLAKAPLIARARPSAISGLSALKTSFEIPSRFNAFPFGRFFSVSVISSIITSWRSFILRFAGASPAARVDPSYWSLNTGSILSTLFFRCLLR
jgi:hypothetical protein